MKHCIPEEFESYVISYRTKTLISIKRAVYRFESYVISYRTKTYCGAIANEYAV